MDKEKLVYFYKRAGKAEHSRRDWPLLQRSPLRPRPPTLPAGPGTARPGSGNSRPGEAHLDPPPPLNQLRARSHPTAPRREALHVHLLRAAAASPSPPGLCRPPFSPPPPPPHAPRTRAARARPREASLAARPAPPLRRAGMARREPREPRERAGGSGSAPSGADLTFVRSRRARGRGFHSLLRGKRGDESHPAAFPASHPQPVRLGRAKEPRPLLRSLHCAWFNDYLP